MTKYNKQRLTLLTRKEKAAANSGGWVDSSIPHDLLRQRLQDEGGIMFDTDAILPKVAGRAGWLRVQAESAAARMEPKEIIQQASDTAAVIDELIERLEHLHPNLAAEADYVLFKAHGEFLSHLRERLEPDLYRLRATICHAGDAVASRPVKTGPKQNAWMVARDSIADELREYSQPVISIKAAKALAVDLLELCDLPSPRGR